MFLLCIKTNFFDNYFKLFISRKKAHMVCTLIIGFSLGKQENTLEPLIPLIYCNILANNLNVYPVLQGKKTFANLKFNQSLNQLYQPQIHQSHPMTSLSMSGHDWASLAKPNQQQESFLW